MFYGRVLPILREDPMLYQLKGEKREMAEEKRPESLNQPERFYDYELRGLKAEVLTLRSEMAAMQAEVGKVYKDVREIKEVLERLSTNTMLMISAVLKISQTAISQNASPQKGTAGETSNTNNSIDSSLQASKSRKLASIEPTLSVSALSDAIPRETPQPVFAESLSNIWHLHSVKTVPNPIQNPEETELPRSDSLAKSTDPSNSKALLVEHQNAVFSSLTSALLTKDNPSTAVSYNPSKLTLNEEDDDDDDNEVTFQFSSEQIETALGCCKRKKNSRRNYATHLLRMALPEKTRRLSNCAGVRGQQPVDRKILRAIKKEVLKAFPLSQPIELHTAWRECIVAMDESCRRLRRLHNSK